MTEPSYRPDLGGFAMIDEEEDTTIASQQQAKDERSANS
jgi:hypothetical protein